MTINPNDALWSPVKIAAGGEICEIIINPDGTKIMRTDGNGAYRWNPTAPNWDPSFTGSWQQLWTEASTATHIPTLFGTNGIGGSYMCLMSPANSNVMYMVDESFFNFVASNNGGATWFSQTLPFSYPSQGAATDAMTWRQVNNKCAVHPTVIGVITITAPQYGCYKWNGGAWVAMAVPPSLEYAMGVHQNSKYPPMTTVYALSSAALPGGQSAGYDLIVSSWGNGFYHSHDGGSTWAQITSPGTPTATPDLTYVTCAHVAPDGLVYYILGALNTNGDMPGGFPAGANYLAIYNPNTNSWSGPNGSSVPAEIKDANGSAQQMRAVAMSNDMVLAAVNENGDILLSYDHAATWSYMQRNNYGTGPGDTPWQNTLGGVHFLDAYGLAWDNTTAPPTLYCATGGGVVRTQAFPTTKPSTWPTVLTGGPLWTNLNSGFCNLQGEYIRPIPGYPAIFGFQDFGMFQPATPSSLPTTNMDKLPSIFCPSLSCDYSGSSPNVVACNMTQYARYTSPDQSAVSVAGGAPGTWTLFPTFPPNSTGTLANPTHGGSIAVQDANNMIWTINTPSTVNQPPCRTTDGGNTWTPITMTGAMATTDWWPLGMSYVKYPLVLADKATPGKYYMYTPGTGAQAAGTYPTMAVPGAFTGLYNSLDYGVTWNRVYPPTGVSTIGGSNEENGYTFLWSAPGVANCLLYGSTQYPGNYGRPFQPTTPPATGYPLMISYDGGVTWTAFAGCNSPFCAGFGAPKVPGGFPTIIFNGWYTTGGVTAYGTWVSTDTVPGTPGTFTNIATFPAGFAEMVFNCSGDMNTYGLFYVQFSFGGCFYFNLP